MIQTSTNKMPTGTCIRKRSQNQRSSLSYPLLASRGTDRLNQEQSQTGLDTDQFSLYTIQNRTHKTEQSIGDKTMLSLILSTIYKQGYYMTYARYAAIWRIWQELEPTKPDDGISGFVAYNVPDNRMIMFEGKRYSVTARRAQPRMKMKTGRFLTRKLHLNNGFLPDTLIQRIASEINYYLFPEQTIRIDTGAAIYDNYRDEVGGHSCMTGHCAEYVGFYVDNPGRFSQIVAEQGNDSARAIVFHLDDGETLLGRIYSTCEYLKDRIRTYAKDHNWLTNDAGCVMSGLRYTDGEMPYMDSMYEYKLHGNTITIGRGLDCCDGELQQTDGYLDTGVYCCCCNCGDNVHEDDVCYNNNGDSYCGGCYDETYGYCEKCEEEYLREDTVCVDGDVYWCEYCADRHAYQCEDCGDWFTSTVTIENEEYCESCAESYPICNDCGEFVKETNDCGYCDACAPDHEDEIPCRAETVPLWQE